MKCDSKVLLKTAAGSGLALAVAYFTFPAAHALILASAPILLALICPVAMLLMMGTMNASKKDDGAKPDNTHPAPGPLGAGRDEA
ncbi:MAG: DUF2933 domain-containing protein [Rhodoferax sp.]